MTTIMTETEKRDAEARFRERAHLSGVFSQHVYDWFVGEWEIRLDGDEFELADDEDLEALGYAGDDETVIVQRKSDGKFFEVALEANVQPVPTRIERAEAAGQMRLPGVA